MSAEYNWPEKVGKKPGYLDYTVNGKSRDFELHGVRTGIMPFMALTILSLVCY